MIGVGDLVVCVDAGPCRYAGCRCGNAATGLVAGRIYRVLDVIEPWPPHWTEIAFDVGLGERPGHQTRAGRSVFAGRFRKILPDKHEACEDEFAILLKLSKQRVKA